MTSDPQTPRRTNDQEKPDSTQDELTDRTPVQPRPVYAGSIHSPISASKFYGTGSHGSSHTGYIAPSASPYREPQLVHEDPIPDLITTEDQWLGSGGQTWPEQPASTDLAWSGGYWPGSQNARKVDIDGRSDEEELRWSDAVLRKRCARPGPGMLPPMLVDSLHDPHHTLYSLNVQPPPFVNTFSPTPEEARTSIPHPQTYYCKEHNGWVLLVWRSSSVLPPLARELDHPLPDLDRRKRTNSCIGEGEQPFGQANRTHHWHYYERAVDARTLNPPFMREDTFLNLYVCCQCSMYCLVSEAIPGVVPVNLVNEFTRDKMANPPPDRTPFASAISGWETIITIIENRLWKDEQRILPVLRPRFQSKIGWNEIVEHIFQALDFPVRSAPTILDSDLGLHPPAIDPATPEGNRTRAKLLRAWAEITAWLAIFKKSKGPAALGGYNTQNLHVQVTAVYEMYQTALGAHVSQIARGSLPDALIGQHTLDEPWRALGMTPTTYSWELLSFAYLAQCRCDPGHTPIYFTHFCNIVQALLSIGESCPELQELVMEERRRHRYTIDNLREAIALLGFGKDSDLRVELDTDVDDNFILDAWRSARRRAWRDDKNASELCMRLNDALRFIADDRGSAILLKAWEDERGSGMTPDAAYSTLEVPKDVDEAMLVTVFLMRVEDQPSQADRMREALTVIAEFTNSERLHQFLATGHDPGDTSSHVNSPDMPRGLNQLGNTCYLNSLLQYFYTIKDLREAIVPLANADRKLLDDTKVTDDDLKRHRVGGRLVTRREILRSKKFVNQLADLFWNLEYCEVPAVTPSLDLAKLALVTSQDEEEEDQDKTGTDSSNDTDATLVEDGPLRSTYEPSSPLPLDSPTESVLGKRHREFGLSMDIDTALSSNEESQPSSSTLTHATHPQQSVASSSKLNTTDQVIDVDMIDSSQPAQPESKLPPLPARRPRQSDDSVMMFGRQHDVSECMDNCIFQIETALLDFQENSGVDDDKTSVIKRLFYGKKRQRLTPLAPIDDARHKSSIHEKEDLFSQLHVNVSDEGHDLYDGLARYFDDVVELEGSRKRMEVSLVDLPPLLQIQLQRVQFDRETQQAYKSQAYVKFGETIYMDRFLDSADPEKKTQAKAVQSDLNASRERIQRLTQDKHAPFAPALGATADFLSSQDVLVLSEVGEDFVSKLRSEQELITAQLERERNNANELKMQIEAIWKDDTSAVYELTSVFVHRGSSPSWGHYFFYSRNLPQNLDQWFKYNDSDVSVASRDEVLADTTGSTANPYMLVFARKGSEAIETVHRFNPETLLTEQEQL